MPSLRRPHAIAVLALALLAGPTAAQQTVPDGTGNAVEQSPILIVDQEQLFLKSDYGKKILEKLEADAAALAAENREIEASLQAEEQNLTAKRATLPSEDFRAMAAGFDEKVVQIRATQDAKTRELLRLRERAPQQFLQDIRPLLIQLAREKGAQVVLDADSVVFGSGQIDITAAMIERINAQLRAQDAPAQD